MWAKAWLLFARWALVAQAVGSPAPDIEITVSPSLFEEILAPGQRVVRTVRLTNRGPETLPVVVSLSDWTMDLRGKVSFSEAGSTPQSCADRITVIPERLLVPPGAAGSVVLILQSPARPDLAKVSRWAAVLFRLPATATTSESGTPMRIAPRLSTTVYMTPNTASPPLLRLVSVSAESLSQDAGKEPRLRAELVNEGGSHARFSAKWEILEKKGSVLETIERKNQVLLPGFPRLLEASGTRPVSPGQYNIRFSLKSADGQELSGTTSLLVGGPGV